MFRSLTATLVLAIVVGIIVGIGGYTFIYAKGYSYLTNDPAACGKCHVMSQQYDRRIKSSHHNAATCGV